jgi:hypothetical protein
MSKQVYEVREDKTMDWGKRLRYSVNYAKQPLHTLSSHASMSEGFAFRVAEMKGISVRFRHSGLPLLSSSY